MNSNFKVKSFLGFTLFWLIFLNCYLIVNPNSTSISLSKGLGFIPRSSTVNTMWNFSYGTNFYDSALSSNGKYVAAGFDNRIFLLNATNKQEFWRATLSDTIFSIAISEDGFYILVGCSNGDLYLFNNTLSSPKTEIWSTNLGSTYVYQVAITPNGTYITAICGFDVFFLHKDSAIPLWNYTTGDSLAVVSISPNGNYVATGGWERVLYVFNKTSSSSKTPMWNKTVSNGVWGMKFSSDEQILAVCGGYSLYIYNPINSYQIWEYFTGNDVLSLDLSADRRYLAASNDDGKFFLFNINTKSLLWEYNSYLRADTIAISSDGSFIAAGSNNDQIYLFNKLSNATKKPLWNYTTGGDIFTVAISSNGRYILTGSGDNYIYLFYNDEPLPYEPTQGGISYGFYLLTITFSTILIISLRKSKYLKPCS